MTIMSSINDSITLERYTAMAWTINTDNVLKWEPDKIINHKMYLND